MLGQIKVKRKEGRKEENEEKTKKETRNEGVKGIEERRKKYSNVVDKFNKVLEKSEDLNLKNVLCKT